MILLALLFILAFIFLLYMIYVPKDTGMLGNLGDSKVKSDIFPESPWLESGFAELPYGRTHYYLVGPKDGKPIIFVHGMTTPPPAIKIFIDTLAAKGFRVLCYDLYGRGYSASPGTSIHFFCCTRSLDLITITNSQERCTMTISSFPNSQTSFSI
jgi:hypothetical protein